MPYEGNEMPDVSSASLSTGPLPIMRPDRTALFLRMHAVQLNMHSNYSEQLEAQIFCQPCGEMDSKLRNKYRKILNSIDAYKVLVNLWKESEFVTDEALAEAGLCREYQGRDVTAHTLAVDLAQTTQQVSKMNSRVRMIGLSAASYNLVDRKLVYSTKALLKGTNLLHAFMSRLSAKNILALSDFAPLASTPTHSSPDSHSACADMGDKK